MDSSNISNVLYIILIVMIAILVVLSVVFCVLSLKGKRNVAREKVKKTNGNNNENQKVSNNTIVTYNKQSILDFMEFEKIEDNMIVVKKGKKYVMVVECQGVNYDLMSQMEKIAVEEGFQQFLNTLRHPIQIYIQTRTVNLEGSIQTYKDKVKDIEDRYRQMMYEYNRMKESDIYSQQEIDKYFFEITKQKNLLEYGKDIIRNTEQLSLNRGVLNKKYYIIVPYYFEEVANQKVDIDEIKNMAFSELYTKCQAVVRTLSACSVFGKILSSRDLIDLLYTAYNRDEAETFGVDKLYRASYEDLYSTALDVFEKKIKALDDIVKDRAVDLANEKMEKARSRAQRIAEEKENSLDSLIDKMATLILDENRAYVGEDIANEAIAEIQKESKKKEEGNKDEKGKKTTTRTRKKTTNS